MNSRMFDTMLVVFNLEIKKIETDMDVTNNFPHHPKSLKHRSNLMLFSHVRSKC